MFFLTKMTEVVFYLNRTACWPTVPPPPPFYEHFGPLFATTKNHFFSSAGLIFMDMGLTPSPHLRFSSIYQLLQVFVSNTYNISSTFFSAYYSMKTHFLEHTVGTPVFFSLCFVTFWRLAWCVISGAWAPEKCKCFLIVSNKYALTQFENIFEQLQYS